jgi:hypothetical protein
MTEALKLALEALEAIHIHGGVECVVSPEGTIYLRTAITAIREVLAQPASGYAKKIEELIQERDALRALAQPEQEPVAYIDVEQRRLQWAKPMSWNTPTTVNLPKIPLYTAPPQPEERNFCQRCGKRLGLGCIHTCTPPRAQA